MLINKNNRIQNAKKLAKRIALGTMTAGMMLGIGAGIKNTNANAAKVVSYKTMAAEGGTNPKDFEEDQAAAMKADDAGERWQEGPDWNKPDNSDETYMKHDNDYTNDFNRQQARLAKREIGNPKATATKAKREVASDDDVKQTTVDGGIKVPLKPGRAVPSTRILDRVGKDEAKGMSKKAISYDIYHNMSKKDWYSTISVRGHHSHAKRNHISRINRHSVKRNEAMRRIARKNAKMRRHELRNGRNNKVNHKIHKYEHEYRHMSRRGRKSNISRIKRELRVVNHHYNHGHHKLSKTYSALHNYLTEKLYALRALNR